MGLIEKFIYYLDFTQIFKKKKKKEGISLRFMHGINRISILIFLIGLIYMVIKYYL